MVIVVEALVNVIRCGYRGTGIYISSLCTRTTVEAQLTNFDNFLTSSIELLKHSNDLTPYLRRYDDVYYAVGEGFAGVCGQTRFA